MSRGYELETDDIIYYDFEHGGDLVHTGIVQSCDGKTATTIEGNNGNTYKRLSYVMGASHYGVPAFINAPKAQNKEKGDRLMNRNEAMGLASMMMADINSIRLLVMEVSGILEPNGSDYSKLHAVYEIVENQERMLKTLDDYLVKIKE